MLGDDSFFTALRNTLYYTALHIPLTMGAALGLALLLNRKLRGVAFFRTAAFFPYITSIVAIAVVWNLLFSPQYGPINHCCACIGRRTIRRAGRRPRLVSARGGHRQHLARHGLLHAPVPRGLQTVPRELTRRPASRRRPLATVLNVTIPYLRPTTFFVDRDAHDRLVQGLRPDPRAHRRRTGQPTLVLSQFIYQKGFVENQFGYASAVSVVLFAICFVVTVIQFLVNKRRAS